MTAAERAEIAHNLRQLIELDRGFGVEFALRSPEAPAPARATPTSAPVARQSPSLPAPRPAEPVRVADAPAPPAAEAWVPDPALFALPAAEALATIVREVAGCTRCPLRAGCQRTVPGEGHASPEILFVGEGPGAEEDAQGRPFVGPAGQLLTKMIEAMGLARADVHIANVVKCRPPGNRTPEPDEVRACMPFLRAQIATLKPKVICALGNTPLRALMGDDALGITRQRGKRLSYQGIPLIPTFHPSYLLRNAEAKKPCWEDLKAVLAIVGRTPPPRA
ncbi:MAG TPA: uracil-DNA glycosylase [Planctomycetota bacterium]|nr:uracil-DNA glycosylase [Planctomycetota bacterium]